MFLFIGNTLMGQNGFRGAVPSVSSWATDFQAVYLSSLKAVQ
jgi:hypothetical protein